MQETKRLELDSRIQASIDAERQEAMKIEEKKREERKKLEEERREQIKKERERKKKIGQRKRIKYRFDRDHMFLKTETDPSILWIPAKHNIRTKKMLQERQAEEFIEPFPEIIPYLPKDSIEWDSPQRESSDDEDSREGSRSRDSSPIASDNEDNTTNSPTKTDEEAKEKEADSPTGPNDTKAEEGEEEKTSREISEEV